MMIKILAVSWEQSPVKAKDIVSFVVMFQEQLRFQIYELGCYKLI